MMRFLVSHPTAANLVMIFFLVAGALTTPHLVRETQPDFAPSEVEVRIRYPGATAAEVEEVVCRRVEDAIDGIDFVAEVRADAREGLASVVVEMDPSGDMPAFLGDIETGVEAIDDFPPEVETPVIVELGRTEPVLSLLVSGPMAVSHLKAYAEDLKDRMQEAGIPLVTIDGFSDHQLRVVLDEGALRRFGLGADDVAARIATQSKDLPLGVLETREKDILLRFVDQRRTPEALERLVILADAAGGQVRLGDIATVEDRFERPEDQVAVDGRRSALLRIEKSKSEDAIRVAQTVKAFVAREQERHPRIDLTVSRDETGILEDRLGLLVSNGIQGLLLVFAVMWLFFNLQTSFWVAMGLPVSFLGAFILVPHLGLSINMFTMVGLLMALGLLMDDAIVIAENIMAHRQRGKAPIEAAVDGMREVAPGVIASFVTTVCILGPLAFIEGQIGRALRVVPMMLILVLAVSLIEAFGVLPAHLSHALQRCRTDGATIFRRRFDNGFARVRDRILGPTVEKLLRWRYLVLGTVVALWILSVGMVASGKIKFQGFPELEGDVIMARLLMDAGTPIARTEATVERILEALARTNETFRDRQPNRRDLVQSAYVHFNRNTEAFDNGPHVATVTVDLLTAEMRAGAVDAYLETWRREIGPLPDVQSLNLSEPGFGPGGRPIEVRLRGRDLSRMKAAAIDLKEWFGRFEGVVNLADDLRTGKPELHLRMREGAYGIGIGAAEVGRQLRAAFQGLTADEIQVGPEAYEIEVRLAGMDRDSLQAIEDFDLRLADGTRVPLESVVAWRMESGWARIARVDGLRAVTLRGDVDTRKINSDELIRLFRGTYLPEFSRRYPDLKLTIEGSLKETRTTRLSMLRAMLIGIIGIFILLSFQFRTYTEPLIVMVAIPFALIGVIWGHGLMGIPISMPSLLGFIALSGVVVNDSILLVLFLKSARREGMDVRAAAARASRERLRAVVLTSSTTIAGLLPLLFEKSFQAQILIPLVTSTAFGLMASTLMVLLVIPCLYAILGDLGITEKIGAGSRPLPDSTAVTEYR